MEATAEDKTMQAKTIQIVEVSPRDGLQNEPQIVETKTKLDLIKRTINAGARRLEVASFVNPKRVPQMADAEAVVAGLPDHQDVRYIGLCLNKRGLIRALETRRNSARGVDEAGCVMVASDTFGMKNQGQTIRDGVRSCLEMLKLARREGLIPQVTISAAFGCPFEGEVAPETVLSIAEELLEGDPVEIALADTIGAGVPGQVGELFNRLRDLVPKDIPLRAHFHNTRDTAVANTYAAHLAGVTVFDASLGGLGGCPFAPRATGNIATEELLYFFKRSGITTGCNLDEYIRVNKWFEAELGIPLRSLVAKAGDFTVSRSRKPAG